MSSADHEVVTVSRNIVTSIRFQDYFSHVWEHSRFIIQTVIIQTWLYKEALLDKNKTMYSALFLIKSMEEMY